MYEIRELGQETDPDEVEFHYLSVYSTPERILAGLTRHNLVFGLSATADIPRLVRNFSLDWLRKQDGVNFIDVTHDDIETIQYLNDKKQNQHRHNAILVRQTKTLGDYQRMDIRQFIQAVSRDAEFGGDTPFHIGRVENFFSTLCQIIETTSPQDTHLFFFNTFRQVKHIFKYHSRWNHDLFQIECVQPDDLLILTSLNMKVSHLLLSS